LRARVVDGSIDLTVLPAREPQWRRPRRGNRAGTAAQGALAPVLELQRMAGNRAVTALLARDSKIKTPPAKTPAKKELPKQNYVALAGMDPIVVESVQLGPSNAGAHTSGHGANREASAPTVSEIVVTSIQGDHSTELFKRSLRGEPFSAEIVFVKPGESTPYMKIKLTNVLISSYSVSGHGGGPDGKPMETWTLNATNIEYETSGAAAAGGRD
jgi:type VI secretion system secreted protein Hcp